MALLPKLDVIAGESLTSFLNRVARFHCNVGLSQFLDYCELTRHDVMLPDPNTMLKISELTGQPPEIIAKMAFVRTGTRQRIIGNELVGERFFSVTKRSFCAACLVEDSQNGSASNGMLVGRLAWQIESIGVCDRHCEVLQRDSIQSYAGRFNSLPELKTDMAQLKKLALTAEKRTPTRLERYIMDRLHGKPGPEWLDGQQLDLAARACEMLGIVLTQGEKVDLNRVSDELRWEAGDIGFSFASRGNVGIKEGLKILYDRHIDRRESGGPQKAFGRLYQWLQYHRCEKSRGSIREPVREFILEHFPVDVGSNLFGQPVTRFRVHTVASLSRQTKFHVVCLRHAVEVVGLIDICEGPKPLHQPFCAKKGEALVKLMQESMPTNALPKYLNCNRVQSEQLVRTGIIPRILPETAVKSGVLTNVGIGAVDDFLNKLLGKAKVKRKASEGMVDIITASQIAHVPVIDIVKGILANDLSKVEILDVGLKFKGVLVHPSEIQSVMSGVTSAGFVWKSEAACLIGLPTEGLTKLTKMQDQTGSPLFTMHFQKVDGLQPKQIIDLEEVYAFQRDHILLKDYASQLGVTPRVASRRLNELGVEAIAPRDELSRRIYRRSDIAF